MKARLFFCCALIALLMLGASALALDGKAGGSAVAQDPEGKLYVATEDAILRVDEGGVARLVEAEASCLQWANDSLYFVRSCAPTDPDAAYAEELCRLDPDTGSVLVIGAARDVYTESAYDEGFFQLISFTSHYGYGEMQVCGDFIYYIGDDATPGTYHTDCLDWAGMEGRTSFCTTYDSCAAIYRIDPEGGDAQLLIGGLGNGVNVHMAILEDRIYVCSCWQNALYAYDFVNFQCYDPEGNLLKTWESSPDPEGLHDHIYKTDQAFTANVSALHVADETLYASFSDSEGDFGSSRFAEVTRADETLLYEACFTCAAVSGRGIAYITSAVQDVFWDEAIYDTLTLHLADETGDTCLAYIPAAYAVGDMELYTAGDYVYALLGNDLLRVNFSGGTPQLLTAEGFVDREEFLPENLPENVDAEISEEGDMDDEYMYLLPYSDRIIYTANDLSIYDDQLLTAMRREIYARHGCTADREYFADMDWYEPDPDFSEDMFNDIERANLAVIDSLLE